MTNLPNEKPITANDGPSNSLSDHCSDRQNDTARHDGAQDPEDLASVIREREARSELDVPAFRAFMRSMPGQPGYALWTLMTIAWFTGAPVKNDDRSLSWEFGLSLREWRRIKQEVLSKCQIVEDGLLPDLSLFRLAPIPSPDGDQA